MAADVLLSIKPRYVRAILEGRKSFEFRRRLPAQELSRVVVYESSPTCSIVGEFRVARVLTDAPANLWARTFQSAGIDRARYDDYFDGRTHAYALEVVDVMRYAEPIRPREIAPQFRAPQSFCYLHGLCSRLQTAIDKTAAAARGVA